jgi:cellulose synthase/poly-beta-1,6-N-acetylglucosamine synthase-like glycosyltransferase
MATVLPFKQPEAVPSASATPAPRRILLGDILVRQGRLQRTQIDAALEAQEGQDVRLGELLLSRRLIGADDLAKALSQQSGLGLVDLIKMPPDPDLMDGLDPYRCMALEAVPWRQVGGTRVIAIASPANAAAAVAAFGGGAAQVAFALAPPAEIRRTVTAHFRRRMGQDAKTRCPEDFSCREWNGARRWRLYGLGGAILAGAAAAPLLFLKAVMVWVLVANAMTMGLRMVALLARFRGGRAAPTSGAERLADHKKLPRVSILVPLLREEKVARSLLDALAAMDYPAALLDIKLVLEEDDMVTRAAIDAAELPPSIDIVTVPADMLRTKPRAMNYALPFCQGEIVGVYDAEDRPDPGQIRAVVAALRDAPPEVACVQGFLDFYNTRMNWLSRCFTIEYAVWFRVVLLGVQRLGIPIPLGGTTVFFRRRVLEEIGGWDAHNVTEDADLGMRLARFGYRCDMIPSTTQEEANCRMGPWIRQRSRWLKGYAITWATHMRDPVQLWRDLGWRGFFGFQVLFLGAITSYLAMPLFWVIWTAAIGFGLAFWETFPQWLMWSFFTSMLLGQVVMLATAVVATVDSRKKGLLPWVLTLPVYWPLGALAAYRAVAELFYAPFHWHKTEHGYGAAEERN